MKLSYVTIEGMNKVIRKKYNLSEVSYLYGPNGCGKSTVLQAIQLALLGYIPGINKTNEAIFSHCNGYTMAVTLGIQDGDDEITVKRMWQKRKSSIASEVEITPNGYDIESLVKELELPIFNFDEFTNMSANTLKAWFVNFLPKDITEIDWDKELTIENETEDDKKYKDKIIDYIKNSDAEGVDLIISVNTYLKSLQSSLKDEISRLGSTVQSLTFYDDVDDNVNSSELEVKKKSLFDEISKISKAEAHNKARELVIQQNKVAQANIDAIHLPTENIEDCDEYKRLREESNNIQIEISRIRSEKSMLSDIANKYFTEMEKHTLWKSQKGVCPFTDELCDKVTDIANADRQKYEELKLKYQDAEANYRQKLNDESEIMDQQTEVFVRMNTIESEYKSLETYKSVIQDIPEEIIIDKNIDDIRNEISKIDDTILKLIANQKYRELSESLVKERFRAERNLELVKIWINLTGANGLQTRLTTQPFIALADIITNNLEPLFGKEVKAAFNLIEKANSFNFGIERDETYIPFNSLSSGEKCLFTLALMISIIQINNPVLKVIMIDDIIDHLDKNNASKLFGGLKNYTDIQFILAGAQECNINDIVVSI